jgi:hypothetical protein
MRRRHGGHVLAVGARPSFDRDEAGNRMPTLLFIGPSSHPVVRAYVSEAREPW